MSDKQAKKLSPGGLAPLKVGLDFSPRTSRDQQSNSVYLWLQKIVYVRARYRFLCNRVNALNY